MTNEYEPNPIGVILGLGLFGMFYVYTLVRIYLDEIMRHKDYAEAVEEDIKTMKELNITDADIKEFDLELTERLAGRGKKEDSSDQLMQEALKLWKATLCAQTCLTVINLYMT